MTGLRLSSLTALIASLGLAACASTGTASTGDPSAANVVTPAAYASNAWLVGHYRERVVLFEGYQPVDGGVVFMGDSITEGGDWAALFPGAAVRNYGISGDRAEGLLARYRQVVAAQPGRILILIGTNDLSTGSSPERIAGEVDDLLGRFNADLPRTQLVVQSVLPRQAEYNARIQDLNTRLKAVARERKAGFIDIHSPFVVAGDRLDPAVTEDDLHLTPPGYQRWARIIEPCVRNGECG